MLIVGLGNPGRQYEMTRHNIGFMVLDELAERHGLHFSQQFKGLYDTAIIGAHKHFFLKPLTYMNLSGEAVGELARYFKIPVEDICVVYDDLDFAYGTLKLRRRGSPGGGHNGIKSLVQHLDSEKFNTVRMGIAGMHRSKISGHTAEYVLAPFTAEERKTLPEFVANAADAVEYAIKNGFLKAMNDLNKKPSAEEGVEE